MYPSYIFLEILFYNILYNNQHCQQNISKQNKFFDTNTWCPILRLGSYTGPSQILRRASSRIEQSLFV